jgi:hypothetical protein
MWQASKGGCWHWVSVTHGPPLARCNSNIKLYGNPREDCPKAHKVCGLCSYLVVSNRADRQGPIDNEPNASRGFARVFKTYWNAAKVFHCTHPGSPAIAWCNPSYRLDKKTLVTDEPIDACPRCLRMKAIAQRQLAE